MNNNTNSANINNTNDNIDEINKSLEQLYLQKKFADAENLMIEMKALFNPGLFHYNYGTLKIKTNDFGAARFHLEKSIKLGHASMDVYNNLKFVKSKLSVIEIESGSNYWARGIEKSLTIPSQLYLTAAFMLLIITMFFVRKLQLKWYYALIFLFLSTFPFLYRYVYLDTIKETVALKNISVREGPSKIFPEIRSVDAGAKFIIGKENDNWFFIEYPEEYAGWVSREDIEFL